MLTIGTVMNLKQSRGIGIRERSVGVTMKNWHDKLQIKPFLSLSDHLQTLAQMVVMRDRKL